MALNQIRVSEINERCESARLTTGRAVVEAAAAWAKAPMHVRALAGDYVGPLLAALFAMNEELQALKKTDTGADFRQPLKG